VLESLVDKGNTVIVIEHNLDVVKTADWIIDMGPEGGHKGGAVVAVGTPEELAETPESHTGQWLRHVLGLDGPASGSAPSKVTTRAAKANGSVAKKAKSPAAATKRAPAAARSSRSAKV
jgi:excinuclease ABC subunit A